VKRLSFRPFSCLAVGTELFSHCLWTVHHDCDRSHFIARTLCSPIKSVIAFDMFFHVEHHLFPSVPTCRMDELSKRLDEAAPKLAKMQVY